MYTNHAVYCELNEVIDTCCTECAKLGARSIDLFVVCDQSYNDTFVVQIDDYVGQIMAGDREDAHVQSSTGALQ